MEDLFVIKIGGETLNNEISLKTCIKALAESNRNIILVHGGGQKVTDLAKKLGINQQLVEGRRITSAETLELCTMVYAGLINKNIVAKLSAENALVIGLSGADLNCVKSIKRQHPTINYGFVGDVKKVNVEVFEDFISKKIIPVICSVTIGENSELLNTNADVMAAEIAKAMSVKYEVNLVYCFEKNGVLTDISDENSVISEISNQDFNDMKAKKIDFRWHDSETSNCICCTLSWRFRS